MKLHPGVFAVNGQKNFKKILNIAGIKKPCFCARPQVRADMPKTQNFLLNLIKIILLTLGLKTQ